MVDAISGSTHIPVWFQGGLLCVGGFGTEVILGLHLLRPSGWNRYRRGAMDAWKEGCYLLAWLLLGLILVACVTFATAIAAAVDVLSVNIHLFVSLP
jgi:hypothetical protein